MKFEEVLPRLRNGEKARVIDGSNSEAWFYGTWIACKASIPYYINDELQVPNENDMWLTLLCLNQEGKPILESDTHSMPLWMVMSTQWEIVNND